MALIFPWIRSATAVAVCLTPAMVCAQYLGGSGDGFTNAAGHNLPLDGGYPPAEAFAGGAADGFARGVVHNAPVDGIPHPGSVVRGGAGDGFARGRVENTGLGTPPPPEVYLGGSGDGFGQAMIAHAPVDGVSLPDEVYSGGGGDGFDALPGENLPIAEPLPEQLFFGGGGDGFDRTRRDHYVLGQPDGMDPNASVMAFGGSGDGFASESIANLSLIDPAAFAGVYAGGGGDGFHAASFFNYSFAPLPEDLFAGGTGDGFAASLRPNHQMIFHFASPADFSVYTNALFTPEEIAAGLADFGVDFDLDGVTTGVEFLQGTNPRNPVSREAVIGPALAEGYLTIETPRTPNALGYRFVPELTSNLGNPGSWSDDEVVIVVDEPYRLVARDSELISANPIRIMRFAVEPVPDP